MAGLSDSTSSVLPSPACCFTPRATIPANIHHPSQSFQPGHCATSPGKAKQTNASHYRQHLHWPEGQSKRSPVLSMPALPPGSSSSQAKTPWEGPDHAPGSPPGVSTYHVSQCNVQKHPSGQSEDPVGREVAAGHNPEGQAHVAAAGGDEIEEERLADGHPGIQQDDKVPCGRRGWGG